MVKFCSIPSVIWEYSRRSTYFNENIVELLTGLGLVFVTFKYSKQASSHYNQSSASVTIKKLHKNYKFISTVFKKLLLSKIIPIGAIASARAHSKENSLSTLSPPN